MLKIKTIPTLINEQGFTASDTVCRVKAVNFDYQQMTITIHWQMFPSTWIEGMSPIDKHQIISMVDEKGNPVITPEQYALILAVSSQIHSQAEAIPFIATFEGLKSFRELGAITTEI